MCYPEAGTLKARGFQRSVRCANGRHFKGAIAALTSPAEDGLADGTDLGQGPTRGGLGPVFTRCTVVEFPSRSAQLSASGN